MGRGHQPAWRADPHAMRSEPPNLSRDLKRDRRSARARGDPNHAGRGRARRQPPRRSRRGGDAPPFIALIIAIAGKGGKKGVPQTRPSRAEVHVYRRVRGTLYGIRAPIANAVFASGARRKISPSVGTRNPNRTTSLESKSGIQWEVATKHTEQGCTFAPPGLPCIPFGTLVTIHSETMAGTSGNKKVPQPNAQVESKRCDRMRSSLHPRLGVSIFKGRVEPQSGSNRNPPPGQCPGEWIDGDIAGRRVRRARPRQRRQGAVHHRRNTLLPRSVEGLVSTSSRPSRGHSRGKPGDSRHVKRRGAFRAGIPSSSDPPQRTRNDTIASPPSAPSPAPHRPLGDLRSGVPMTGVAAVSPPPPSNRAAGFPRNRCSRPLRVRESDLRSLSDARAMTQAAGRHVDEQSLRCVRSGEPRSLLFLLARGEHDGPNRKPQVEFTCPDTMFRGCFRKPRSQMSCQSGALLPFGHEYWWRRMCRHCSPASDFLLYPQTGGGNERIAFRSQARKYHGINVVSIAGNEFCIGPKMALE
eukprot:gene7292-biopygen8394